MTFSDSNNKNTHSEQAVDSSQASLEEQQEQDFNEESANITNSHWLFRTNFFILFGLSLVVYYSITLFFGLLVLWAGKMDADCVRVGGDPLDNSTFTDAYDLSWTTFSTVGYGSVYPALSHEHVNPSGCAFITIVLTVESFFGLWFTASCGAILFAKLLNMIMEQCADNYHHTVGCHNIVLHVFQTNLNFLGLFGFSCIVYYALTIFFGLMVLLSGELDEQCVFVNGIYYSGGFADPYQLSWQTFTTVGYGLIVPSTSANHYHDNPSLCLFIRIILTLEAFVGLWFSASCGALLIAKVFYMKQHEEASDIEMIEPTVQT